MVATASFGLFEKRSSAKIQQRNPKRCHYSYPESLPATLSQTSYMANKLPTIRISLHYYTQECIPNSPMSGSRPLPWLQARVSQTVQGSDFVEWRLTDNVVKRVLLSSEHDSGTSEYSDNCGLIDLSAVKREKRFVCCVFETPWKP
jgi:hypothetical protein